LQKEYPTALPRGRQEIRDRQNTPERDIPEQDIPEDAHEDSHHRDVHGAGRAARTAARGL
jgi:hypothetical protein